MSQYCENCYSLQKELDALKKEYDEEVISHDIEEKDFKEKIKRLKEIEFMYNGLLK